MKKVKFSRLRAFTLTELLVVVIVLGVLAAVAVPKFSRVLETRKTTEAENMLSAVRTEQEKRCSLGMKYASSFENIPAAASASLKGAQSTVGNYTYQLTNTGMVAANPKGYSLQMLSYKSGQLCCDGDYCAKLNKDYPLCSSIAAVEDECATTVTVPTDPCVTTPNSCDCSTYAAAHPCECSGVCTPCETDPNSCECNPAQEKCCTDQQKWEDGQCVDKTACELEPNAENCCQTGEVYENGECRTACQPDEKWNPATKACEKIDDCKEAEEYVGTATAFTIDTCNGDHSSKYTCDGVYRGTCIDVYSGSFTLDSLASYTRDPFGGMMDAFMVAEYQQMQCECGRNTGLTCPPGSTCDGCLCSFNTQIKCFNGQQYNPATGRCENLAVKLCPDGQTWDAAQLKCVGDIIDVGGGEIMLTYSKRKVTCCGTGEPEDKLCAESAQTCLKQGQIFRASDCTCQPCGENQITTDGVTCVNRTPCPDLCQSGYKRNPLVQYQELGSCCVVDTCTVKPWYWCGGLNRADYKCLGAGTGWSGGTESFAYAPDYITTYKCLDDNNQPCESPNCVLPSCADNAFFQKNIGLCCKSALGNRPECCGCVELMPHDWCGPVPEGQMCAMKCKRCGNALGNTCAGCSEFALNMPDQTPPEGYIPTPGGGGLVINPDLSVDLNDKEFSGEISEVKPILP